MDHHRTGCTLSTFWSQIRDFPLCFHWRGDARGSTGYASSGSFGNSYISGGRFCRTSCFRCPNRKRLDSAEQEAVDRLIATSGAAPSSYLVIPSPLPVTTSGAISVGTSGGLSGIPDQLYQLILELFQGTRGVAAVLSDTASSPVPTLSPASFFDTGHSERQVVIQQPTPFLGFVTAVTHPHRHPV